MPSLRSSRNLLVSVVSLFVLLAGLLGVAAAKRVSHRPIRHDTAFRAVPGSKLKIRAVVYDGSTNGTLTVQVKNPHKTVQKFSANGLYFVPEGDPDTAPQRLGAVGPMQIASDAARKELTEIEIAAGATVELQLDVFCIDSHRSSPSPANRFDVGASRMPRELAATIEQRANLAVDEVRADGFAAPRPAAKGKIQSEVWRSRDARWVELDGEGKQEAAKKR
jgi:hypothetical protein